MERFAPGAWRKTIKERADKIRALFQHGADPMIGDKPLGPFRKLEEDDGGGYAEVALLDTSYNRDLLPGLQEGLYGSSHRFARSGRKKSRPRSRPIRTRTRCRSGRSRKPACTSSGP
jgi:HK97 family phage prohead protease